MEMFNYPEFEKADGPSLCLGYLVDVYFLPELFFVVGSFLLKSIGGFKAEEIPPRRLVSLEFL